MCFLHGWLNPTYSDPNPNQSHLQRMFTLPYSLPPPLPPIPILLSTGERREWGCYPGVYFDRSSVDDTRVAVFYRGILLYPDVCVGGGDQHICVIHDGLPGDCQCIQVRQTYTRNNKQSDQFLTISALPFLTSFIVFLSFLLLCFIVIHLITYLFHFSLFIYSCIR